MLIGFIDRRAQRCVQRHLRPELPEILGYFFYPFARIMGIPKHEALQVGSIMATKLVSNEFVAMMELRKCLPNCRRAAPGSCRCSRCPSPTSPPSASWPVRSRSPERTRGQRGVALWPEAGVRLSRWSASCPLPSRVWCWAKRQPDLRSEPEYRVSVVTSTARAQAASPSFTQAPLFDY